MIKMISQYQPENYLNYLRYFDIYNLSNYFTYVHPVQLQYSHCLLAT